MEYHSILGRALCFLLCLAGIIGCQSPPPSKTQRYAAVTTQAGDLGLRIPEFDSNQDVDESGPFVELTTRVVSGDASFWGPWDPETSDGTTFISKERLEEIIDAVKNDPEVRQLTSPVVTLFSGQQGYTPVVTQRAYIKDLNRRTVTTDDQEHVALEPDIGTIEEGVIVESSPIVEGETVRLSVLSAQVCFPLGRRDCTADIAGDFFEDGELGPDQFKWSDPVFMTAKSELRDPISIPDGESILVRLRFQIEQATSNVRGYARDGKISETFVPLHTPLAAGKSVLHEDTVVIITAKVR
jgi:hypothetical protein